MAAVGLVCFGRSAFSDFHRCDMDRSDGVGRVFLRLFRCREVLLRHELAVGPVEYGRLKHDCFRSHVGSSLLSGYTRHPSGAQPRGVRHQGVVEMAGLSAPPGLTLPLCAEAGVFEPPMLKAIKAAAAAAGREAAAFPFCDAEAASQAFQLETMVEALEQDLNADVETGLAAAADASRAAGWREVETRCYDALIATCCSDQPIDAVAGAGRHIVPHDAVGQRLIAAFGRDFGPGGQNEDLYLWSRILGARYKIYGGGGKRS